MSERQFYREMRNLYLAELLTLCLRDGSTQEGTSSSGLLEQKLFGDWAVQQTAQFIRDHYAEDCELLRIGRTIGCSERYIRQRFKEALDISHHRYLLEYRIQRAQAYIESSNYSFKEIADMVGFKSIHHFARTFHEISNETPGAWRRKFQAGICNDVNIARHFVNTNWTVQTDSIEKFLAGPA